MQVDQAPFLIDADTMMMMREPTSSRVAANEHYIVWDEKTGKPASWAPEYEQFDHEA